MVKLKAKHIRQKYTPELSYFSTFSKKIALQQDESTRDNLEIVMGYGG